MIWRSLEKYRDEGLLIARLGFGLGLLFYHGWEKIVDGPERWTSTGSAVSHLGIDFGHTFFGLLAALLESVGGLMIASGLFFRPICALLFLEMLVVVNYHYAVDRGNPGHAFKNAFFALGLMFVGPGKYSLDELISRKLAGRRQGPDAG